MKPLLSPYPFLLTKAGWGLMTQFWSCKKGWEIPKFAIQLTVPNFRGNDIIVPWILEMKKSLKGKNKGKGRQLNCGLYARKLNEGLTGLVSHYCYCIASSYWTLSDRLVGWCRNRRGPWLKWACKLLNFIALQKQSFLKYVSSIWPTCWQRLEAHWLALSFLVQDKLGSGSITFTTWCQRLF